MVKEQKYIMRFKGNIDLRELTIMKHPLQAMFHKGDAPTIKIKVLKDQMAFVLSGYYGPQKNLEDSLAKHVSKLHIRTPMIGGYTLEPLTEEEYVEIKQKSPDTTELEEEKAILESLIDEKTAQELWYQEEVDNREKQISGLRKTIENLGQKEKTSTKNYNFARQTIDSLLKEREQLYKDIAELNKQTVFSPEGCALREISNYAANLQKISAGLDDLIEGVELQELENWRNFGKQDLNKILEEEATKIGMSLAAINERPGKFEDTTFYKENVKKYEEAKTAVAYWQEVENKTPEPLKPIVREAIKLDYSRETVASFEKEREEFDKRSEICSKISELREKYERAREFARKMDEVDLLGKMPCLLLRVNGEAKAYFPNPNSDYLQVPIIEAADHCLTEKQENIIKVTYGEHYPSPAIMAELGSKFNLTEITRHG